MTRYLVLIQLIAAAAIVAGLTQAVTAAPSPVTTMYVWNSGAHGDLAWSSSGGTVQKGADGVHMTIPASITTNYITPIDIPAKMDGHPARVRTIYLNLNAPPDCYISGMGVYSGAYLINQTYTSIPGTGTEQTVSFDLGAPVPCLKGLSILWSFTNPSGSSQRELWLYGVGAKIRY